MPKRSEFVDYLLELYQGWGGVSARGMFGGHGIYRDGVMFGLVADEVFYLKVDEQNRSSFEEADSGPFLYDKGGKQVAMSYWRCPESALDDPDELLDWSRPAYDAALRGKKPKRSNQK